MVLPLVPLVNVELTSLIEEGDLGVAVMVLATNFVESLSGVKPTFRTLSLQVSRIRLIWYSHLPDGHQLDDVSLQPGMGTIGADVHPLSLLELHEVHEKAISSVYTKAVTVSNSQRDKDRSISPVELVKDSSRFRQSFLVLGRYVGTLVKSLDTVLLDSTTKFPDRSLDLLALHREIRLESSS